MATYTMTDLERLTGIKADTIRVWEKRYSLLTAHRTITNRRWYTGEDLKKLINVATLNKHGFKISTIASMPARDLRETAAGIAGSIADSEVLINSLVIAMSEFNEAAVNEILLKSVIRKGFERTITSVVFPFLRRVGVMWHTGSTNVASEHFISSIVRRILLSAYDDLSPKTFPSGRKVLLFLPENEYHDLSLLYYAYFVRSYGHEVLYLGQSTPLNAVDEAIKSWNPDVIITGALSGLSVGDYEEFISGLKKIFPEGRIILAGSLAAYVENKKTAGFYYLVSDKDLHRLLK